MLSILVASTVLFSFAARAADVALYWGQYAYDTLAETCASEEADIIILSFLFQFGIGGATELNLAGNCESTYPDGLLHCPQIGQDIKTCQLHGKKILLSLGGGAGVYGFANDTAGADFATTLWNMFGNGEGPELRPFDDAVVDGFDFDIESGNTGYAACANKLKYYFDSDTSKKYYISAAPQCPYPDASVGNLLTHAHVDFAFIQFYNNDCSPLNGNNFNWDVWVNYAENDSPNKDIKLYLGLPASQGAASTGYANVDQVESTVQQILSMPGADKFGGIMLWDAYWSFTNQVNGLSFANNMQQLLDQLDPSTTSTTSTSFFEETITSEETTTYETTTSDNLPSTSTSTSEYETSTSDNSPSTSTSTSEETTTYETTTSDNSPSTSTSTSETSTPDITPTITPTTSPVITSSEVSYPLYIWTGTSSKTLTLTYVNGELYVPASGLFKRADSTSFSTIVLIPTPSYWAFDGQSVGVLNFPQLLPNGQTSTIPLTLSNPAYFPWLTNSNIPAPTDSYTKVTTTSTGFLPTTVTSIFTTTNAQGSTVTEAIVIIVEGNSLSTSTAFGPQATTFTSVYTGTDGKLTTGIIDVQVSTNGTTTLTATGTSTYTTTLIFTTTNAVGVTVTITDVVIHCPRCDHQTQVVAASDTTVINKITEVFNVSCITQTDQHGNLTSYTTTVTDYVVISKILTGPTTYTYPVAPTGSSTSAARSSGPAVTSYEGAGNAVHGLGVGAAAAAMFALALF